MGKFNFSSIKTWISIIIIVIIAIAFYLTVAAHITPSTNDAVVHINTISISSQIAGRIEKVTVNNNQFVTKGQILLQIDKRPYEINLATAQAALVETSDNVKQLQAQIQLKKLLIQQEENDLKLDKQKFEDYQTLYKQGNLSEVQFLEMRTQYSDQQKQLLMSKQELIQAQQNLGPNIDGINIHIHAAETSLTSAKLQLSETQVVAPENGYITNLNTTAGNYAQVGSTLMALVADTTWWVYANIKENNLQSIKLGDNVLVSLSLFPGKIFHGRVTGIAKGISISQGGPSTYLPYVEKTHDWVRMAQRFPVEIQVNNSDINLEKSIRAGSSAKITVLTSGNTFWNSLAYFYQWLSSLVSFF